MLDANQIVIDQTAAHALVAANEATSRERISRALRQTGYAVTEAHDGAGALDQLGGWLSRSPPIVPDVIVLDLAKDNITAIHVLAALRGIAHAIPVIAIAPREQHDHARMLGATVVVERVGTLLAACDDRIAEIVHDLRNPLNVIELEALLLEGASPAVDRALERIRSNVRFMDRLIGELLDAAQVEIQRHPTELAALVEHVVDRAVAQCDRDRVRIEVRDQVTVLADELRLQRVIENLIANGLKYAPAGSSLIVRLEDKGAVACVSVIDAGPGLTPAEADAVFERYRRASPLAGTGLGLYVSRKIVEAHGGRLAVDSSRGSGSRFYLELPTLQ